MDMRSNGYLVAMAALAILLTSQCAAQEQVKGWGLGLSGGLATFSMNDLKEYQSEKQNYLPEAKIVKSFPAYGIGSLHVVYKDDTKIFDLSVGRTSTGGRTSYSDYSGEYSHDLTVVMGYSAASVGFRVATFSKWNVFIGPQVILYSNLLKDQYHENIYDVHSHTTTYKYVSINLAFAPLVEFHRSLGHHFLLREQTSYEIHVPGPLTFEDDADFELESESGEPVKVQAQGLRIKIGIVYIF